MAEGRNSGRVSFTIGTAGHVDHGKTTLVRYMTGTDTDRLEEEHRRGISIVAGYAELVLPGGVRASLVDVPGHERFVKNMVAGATGVDAFLLVVAADDGVMPQTREHLDVLRVLGVERGVVALTKIDTVDEEMVEIARLDVEELLEETGVAAEIYPVSGVTGEGVDDLLEALGGLAKEPSRTRDGGTLARLPVDRAFVLKGIGVVVTGTLWSGEVRVGDTLYTSSGIRPRVRGVQNHGRPAEVAGAGARTALDLVGVEASEVHPGDVLLSRPVPETRQLDTRLRLLESAKPLAHGIRVRVHHGTRDVNARVRLHGGEGEVRPGESALARLRLEEPLVLLSGDRFVIRSLAPQVTIGGGTVIDPSPSGRRPDAAWLEALESSDAAKTIPVILSRSPKDGLGVEELATMLSLSLEDLASAAESLPEVAKIGVLYALASEVEAAKERLVSVLARRAAERPESPELTVAEARVATGLSPKLADAVLAGMSGDQVKVSDSGVGLSGTDEIPPELEAGAEQTLEELRRAGSEPPSMEPTSALRLLLRRKEAVAIGEKLFAAREASDDVLEAVKSVCREEGDISLAGLRDRLGTSRKFAQAWLEHADAEGITVRTGDVRVLTRRHR